MAGFVGGTGTSYPVAGTQLGLALETARGTLESAPAYMFPVREPKYEPMQAYIPDQTLQGSAVKTYDEVLGMRYDKHGWSSYPYLDSFPLLVIGELGSTDTLVTAIAATTLSSAATAGASTVSLTGTVAAGDWITFGTYPTLETHLVKSVTGSGPYVATLADPVVFAQANGAAVTGLTGHKMSLLNTTQMQPPSLSLWDNDNEQWRSMAACQLDELTIKGNATGMVEYTVTLLGNPAVNNATAPSVSYTGTRAPAPWTFGLQLGGTQLTTVEDWEISLKRSTKEVPAVTGTQEYFQYFADVLDISGKLTFVEQSGSPYLANYLNGTEESIDFTIFDMKAGGALNVHSTNAFFTVGSLERGSEYVKVPITFDPMPTSTDALAGGVSPVLVQVANSVTTQYWAG